jgi:hypothetical protein
MMRWLIFRIMLTSGLVKVLGGDPHWRDFTFMEKLYETSPGPTVLAYYAYHLPHVWHVLEILFTFTAELVAPLVALFGGRRGRLFAVVVWTVFQLGIQLTGNFGWLNTAAIALGLLLLDDQMIAAGLRRLGLARWAERLAATARPAPVAREFRFVVLGVLLWLHFGVTVYYTIIVPRHDLAVGAPDPLVRPVEFFTRDFLSANCYILYVSTPPVRDEVEFAGSADGGRTWRPYPFRYKPQAEDRMYPFLAPRFGRFEATLQIVLNSGMRFNLIPNVAHALAQGNTDVVGLFARNPFPDAPPGMVRMIVYRYTYTDLATHRATGRYWNKQYMGEYAPPVTASRP